VKMSKVGLYRLVNIIGAVIIFLPAYLMGKYVLLATIGAVLWSIFWGMMAKRELQKERASRLRLVVRGRKNDAYR